MDEPIDYRHLAAYLRETRGMPSVEIKTPYWSTWMDNSKAKFLLGWRPRVDLRQLVEKAWSYQRSESDTRKVWYPGQVLRPSLGQFVANKDVHYRKTKQEFG